MKYIKLITKSIVAAQKRKIVGRNYLHFGMSINPKPN